MASATERVTDPGPVERASHGATPAAAVTAVTRVRRFIQHPITGWGLLGAMLLWAAFPPLGLAMAAWPAVAVWIWLCRSRPSLTAVEYGRWYLVGLLHWLLVIHWVRLPHWSTWFGWIALSMYLAAYLPVFVALLRVALRLRIPVVCAAPVVWTGLEWLRGHLLTGLSISLLGHTQVGVEPLIQMADVFGAYGVSFLVVLVASCPAQVVHACCPSDSTVRWRRRWINASTLGPCGLALLILASAYAYGVWRMERVARWAPVQPENLVRVALIQGSVDTTFSDEDTTQSTFAEYARLTRTACEASGRSPHDRLDLIIWPESMFAYPWVEVSRPVEIPADADTDAKTYRSEVDRWRKWTLQQTRDYCASVGVPMLVGAGKLCFGPHPVRRFNSALFFNAQGTMEQSYDKMRPVLFGEYLPLGNLFPWLYRLTPMPNGLDRGTAPLAIECAGLRFCPCICFENTIPHLLRQQYRQLSAAGKEPDVLVTLTNDGWFWGSSLLDTHLACGIFRAVELRRPMLIAANTGFSAWIDAAGHVVRRGPRRDQGVVIAQLSKMAVSHHSVYLAMGDWPAIFCSCSCGFLLLVGIRR